MKDRLTDWQIPVRREAAERHVAAIESALGDEARSALSARPPIRIRRRMVYVMAALVIAILPTGAAIAAERAVPGDFLYPVKRVTESIRAVWDDDVAAQHRVDELQVLIDRGLGVDELTDAVGDARREVDSLVTDHPLRDRLTDLLQQDGVTDRATDVAPSDAAPTESSSDAVVTDVAPSDSTGPNVASDDWPPPVVDLLIVLGAGDIGLDSLPGEIAEIVSDFAGGGRDSLTNAEIIALTEYADDHPELFEPSDVGPTDSVGNGGTGAGGSGGGSDHSDQGGDQPQD